ncbi:hypothetical protein KKC52_08780 [bacterium]|nr:hypothetical protein [bacterium]
MKKFCVIVVVILWVILGIQGFSYGSWIEVPLLERVEQADLVIVGTLTNVDERHFSITYYKNGTSGKTVDYSRYYDLGEIKVSKFLKVLEKPYHFSIPIAFHSKDQTGPYGISLHVSTDITLNEGQQGIWLLKEDELFTGFFRIMRPDNLLPIDSLQQIEQLLQKE